jgi:hypothetical protein
MALSGIDKQAGALARMIRLSFLDAIYRLDHSLACNSTVSLHTNTLGNRLQVTLT